jgi:hypothetical protein
MDTQQRATLGLMTVNIFSANSQFAIIFLFAFFIVVAYSLGGFYCIGMLAIGLFSSFITLLSINFLGGFTSDGLKCAKVTRSYGVIVDRLYKMAWSARNYSVYAQIINGTGIFLTNIVLYYIYI